MAIKHQLKQHVQVPVLKLKKCRHTTIMHTLLLAVGLIKQNTACACFIADEVQASDY